MDVYFKRLYDIDKNDCCGSIGRGFKPHLPPQYNKGSRFSGGFFFARARNIVPCYFNLTIFHVCLLSRPKDEMPAGRLAKVQSK